MLMRSAGLMEEANTVMTSQLLLTPEAAADRLAIGRSQMYELLRSGAVGSVKIGRLRRIPAVALEEYVSALRTPSAA